MTHDHLPTWFDTDLADDSMKVTFPRSITGPATVKAGSLIRIRFSRKVEDEWKSAFLWVLWVMDDNFPAMDDSVKPYRYFIDPKEAINTAMMHNLTAMTYEQFSLPDYFSNIAWIYPNICSTKKTKNGSKV